MKTINVAVIGTGNLGQHHARIYAGMEGVNLAGIADLDEKQLAKISAQHGVRGYADYRELIGKVDAASVATPTGAHYAIASDLLSRGINCLVEKPIASSLEDAEKLVETAKRNNVILQVGHIERFNPAVMEAQKYVRNPKFIEAYRMGGYDPRVKDIGVILDLMIHDIDLVLYLTGSSVKRVESYGAKVFSKHEDIAKARLYFENNCIADLTASRISNGRYRKIRVFQENSYISLDCMRQMLKVYRKKHGEPQGLQDIEAVHHRTPRQEPLKLELEHFVDCVRNDRRPHVTGEHGRDALKLGIEILNNLKNL